MSNAVSGNTCTEIEVILSEQEEPPAGNDVDSTYFTGPRSSLHELD